MGLSFNPAREVILFASALIFSKFVKPESGSKLVILFAVKNKFSSCDFNSFKSEQVNFNKGLLNRINNIKHKISEGIYRHNLLKNVDTQKTYSNEMKNKKSNCKSKKIYENKIFNENKENISPQFLIKVNKSKYYGNMKSQLYINNDISYNGIYSTGNKKIWDFY